MGWRHADQEGVTLRRYAWITLVAATSTVVGVIWDISWHRSIGRDTFWTPAHLAIYLGGALAGGWCCGRRSPARPRSGRPAFVFGDSTVRWAPGCASGAPWRCSPRLRSTT